MTSKKEARCRFADIACDLPFIASLIHFPQPDEATALHSQDFWEIEYSIAGAGANLLHFQAEEHETMAGSLSLIPAARGHIAKSRGDWQFINVAFRAEDFRDWCRIAGFSEDFAAWKAEAVPIECAVPVRHQAACETVFKRMATLFGLAAADDSSANRSGETKARNSRLSLELCRFWSEVMPFFRSRIRHVIAPPWLESALKKMQNEEDLRGGHARLCSLCCVAPEHLARVFRAVHDQTPTQWINEMRLQRAASLLLSTTREIDDIGASCGFENHSYFYRLFARRFGLPPRAFRLQARGVWAR